MINRIAYWIAKGVDPYDNLALEEELLNTVEEGECILYLWQNKKTVVIGRNQSCRKECRVDELERDGGQLARRLSGGGAVFHDLGNLNFTFLAHKPDYDLDRQMEVILQAVRALGIHAERTGRNDVAVDGRKFSGNAFYSAGNRKYHHGTLLVSADMEMLSRYLTVSQEKLRSHGVQSVRSRVVNLGELAQGVSVSSLEHALILAFGRVYNLQPQPLEDARLNQSNLEQGRARFASWEWRIGNEPRMTCRAERRFGWGGVELGLLVENGSIAEVTVYTDALDAEFAPILSGALTGVRFYPAEVSAALRGVFGQNVETSSMIRDVATLTEEFFL